MWGAKDSLKWYLQLNVRSCSELFLDRMLGLPFNTNLRKLERNQGIKEYSLLVVLREANRGAAFTTQSVTNQGLVCMCRPNVLGRRRVTLDGELESFGDFFL
ncbi:hypothetical protein YC2023_046044 [Brassica napus]